MTAPIQAGTELLYKAAPTFTDFVVVGGTWRERDTAEQDELQDGNADTVNITTSNPGVDATCDWAVKAAADPVIKGDTVVELDGDERSYVVVDQEQHNFGKGIRQTVTLRYKTSLDLS